MGMLNRSAALGRVMLAALLLAGATSAAARVLVVRANGPSRATYPPGRSLPDNGRITLRAGDTLTVLDARGTRTFRGPGNFNPSVAPPVVAPRTTLRDGEQVRVGVVRNFGFLPWSGSSIFDLDVGQRGRHCLPASGGPALWRADSAAAATATITAPDGTRRDVAWAAGEANAAWPDGLPVVEGRAYTLSRPGEPVPVEVEFRRLRSQPADTQAVAAALIEAGCQAQLDLLVDSQPQ